MAALPLHLRKKSTAKSGSMEGQHDFPVLFTIDGSKRHEIILVNPGHDLSQLIEAMEGVSESPNCAEFLSKYRSKENKESFSEIRVKWSSEGKHLFPKETLLTDDNVEPVLRMLALGGGRDVLDVKIASKPAAESKKE